MSATLTPSRPPSWSSPYTILFVLLCFAVGTCSAKSYSLNKERRRFAAAALVADTLEATRDTTRRLKLALGVLADGTQALERRSVQVAQQRDSIDRALRAERVAKAQLSIEVARVNLQGAARTVERGDSTHAFWSLRSTPYTIEAEVAMPNAPTGMARFTIGVALDTLHLEYRLLCKPADERGIRPASLAVFGPKWIKLSIDRMEQDPDICRSPALAPRDSRSRMRKLLDRLGLNAGYSGVSSGGRVYTGPSLGLSARIWP